MKSVRLSDGTLLEPKINFLTIKLLQDAGIDKLQKQLQRNPNDKNLEMECVSKFLYALIRSSGHKVDEEEALSLIPLDDVGSLVEVINEFAHNLDEFKKKPAKNTTKRKK